MRCGKDERQRGVRNQSIIPTTSSVSTIIGTIIMVLVLTVIAGAIYFYVESSIEEPPKKIITLMEADYSIETGELIITHLSGDTITNAVNFTSSGSEPSKGWGHHLFQKRIPIIIQTSSSISTEKQYRISIPYDNDMNNDFSDLRFLDSNGIALSYWIEEVNTGSTATIWVSIPTLQSGETTMYLYYGNKDASSISDADATFPLFIDFESDAILSYGGSNQDRNPSQWEILSDNTLRMYGNNWKAVLADIACQGDGSQSLDFSFKSTGVTAEINGLGLDTDNSISSNLFYHIHGTQNWGRNDHNGYSGNGDWQFYRLILNDYHGNMNRIVITNDADSGQQTNVFYKDIRISSYPSINPTITVHKDQEESISTGDQQQNQGLDNLQLRINGEKYPYDSIDCSTEHLFAGDSITIIFNQTEKPEKGDILTLRYVPTNQLLLTKKIS